MNKRARYFRHPGQWAIGVALAVIAVLLVIAMRRSPIEAEVVLIDRGTVRSTVTEEARTRINEVFIVSTPVIARMLRISVEPGDRVKKGDPLATLVGLTSGFLDFRGAAQLRAELTAAEARRKAAVLERDSLAREFARLDTLAEARLVADSQRDIALNRWRVAEEIAVAATADEQRVRNALSRAGVENDSDRMVVRAPSAGVVLSVMQKSEAVLPAGTPVVSLGDEGLVDIVAEFLSQEAVRIRAGDRAWIENWGGATSTVPALAAIVDRIEPVAYTKVSALGIEEQRTRVILKFAEPVPAPLRAHGYRVDARIIVDEAPRVVRVPLGALFRETGEWAVYVVRDGRARRQTVTIGLRDGRFAEIRDGLRPGERVIVFPSSEVFEGVRVRNM